MIVWINGAFGSGKTSLAQELYKLLPDSMIYDPEQIGIIIHKSIPECRNVDFQNFGMWRKLVIEFAAGFQKEFEKSLIIPMTLVVPEFIEEIFSKLAGIDSSFFHFYINIEKATLQSRITNQIMVPNDRKQDENIRKWRLQQIDRCLESRSKMPLNTRCISSEVNSSVELARSIMSEISTASEWNK
jgi:hypothetical protein